MKAKFGDEPLEHFLSKPSGVQQIIVYSEKFHFVVTLYRYTLLDGNKLNGLKKFQKEHLILKKQKSHWCDSNRWRMMHLGQNFKLK